MMLAVDVDYRDTQAYVSGVLFQHWRDAQPLQVIHCRVEDVNDYEPGKFYLREMPCILRLLEEHHLEPDVIIIDGDVYLGLPTCPGLGMHLYHALHEAIVVVSVAKKPFKDTRGNMEILRGESAKSLYVTAVGMPLEEAKAHVGTMHGNYRIPTLLKRVDRECRNS